MNRRIKIIGIPAIMAASILTATMPAWAGPGILPLPTRQPVPTYTCAPHIPAAKARAALVATGNGNTYRLYTGKELAFVRATARRADRITWCV